METQKKPIYKSLLFWEVLIGAAVILGIIIFILVELNKPLPDIADTSPATLPTQAETTEAVTEPTFPPPEANPIGLGDFATKDGYLSCLTTPSVLGIDVSYWQGEIDWQQVKDAGIEYVILRIGQRGSV